MFAGRKICATLDHGTAAAIADLIDKVDHRKIERVFGQAPLTKFPRQNQKRVRKVEFLLGTTDRRIEEDDLENIGRIKKIISYAIINRDARLFKLAVVIFRRVEAPPLPIARGSKMPEGMYFWYHVNFEMRRPSLPQQPI
jgi:hypothetical protein